MKSLVLKLSSSLLIAGLLIIFFNVSASAQGVNDFAISKMDVFYNLTNQDPQGFLEVTETVELNFAGQNRGILRAIPKQYKGNDLNINIKEIKRDGSFEPYITYDDSNGNTVIRIGNPEQYITGEHEYKISYTLENVISFYENYDEFYWDVNGDDWLQTIDQVNLILKTGAQLNETQAVCFTGNFGVEDQKCDVKPQSGGINVTTTEPLQPGQTLTVVQAYEKGYFTQPGWFERNRNLLLVIPLIITQIYIVYRTWKKWLAFGKDYKKRSTAPFFGRPRKVSVMQAAYVHKNNLSPVHLSASIIDLAIRGYINIKETGKGKKLKHELILNKNVDGQLTSDESLLIEELFTSGEVGEVINIDDKKNKLYKSFIKIKKTVEKTTTEKGFYELSPSKSASKVGGLIALSAILMIIGIIASIVLENPVATLTGVICFVTVLVFMALMSKRSKSGVELLEHMEGLKLYLGYSEKDRLAAHDAVEAPLAKNAGQPEKTREFYEKLLPFAIALGVEKTWSDAFSDIYEQPPEWYSGNWQTFSAVALANSISSINTVTNQSFSAPSSSGSSGFSGGGGFAGGGGGGGGGGGW